MFCLHSTKHVRAVLLIAAAVSLPFVAACAQKPGAQPVESTPVETSVVQPDGVAASGSGTAMPAQVGGGKQNKPKKVKVNDIAKPGTPAYTIREFEEKTQKEFFQNRQGMLTELKDPELAQTFGTKLNWSLLRYPIWPIAMMINPPLQSNNLFVVDGKNKIVAHLTDMEMLKKFCLQNMHSVKTEQHAKEALLAYLRLQQELAQDGMFQFGIKRDWLKVSSSGGRFAASGRSVVAQNTGNEGYLESKLVFGADGKLVSAESVNKLQEGMRPICQSTKLLDPDPIVRRMAEQDILLMGTSCKFYLDEMRAKAMPEMQQAIDRILKQIEKREAARESRDVGSAL
ncbi:MAG: hypothetical protein IT342_08885 [Candidatus Melainabacteria bacterium]|nr:hypothetical protein [Candidatus Melainabacteria bacterium]